MHHRLPLSMMLFSKTGMIDAASQKSLDLNSLKSPELIAGWCGFALFVFYLVMRCISFRVV